MARGALKILSDQNAIRTLMSALQTKRPFATPMYHWIRMQQRWVQKVPAMKLQLLCPDVDHNEGSVVGISSGLMEGGLCEMLIYADPENANNLVNRIKKSTLIPWPKIRQLMYAVQEPMISLVRDLLRDMRPGVCYQEDDTHLFHMETSQAQKLSQLSLPPGVHLGPLNQEHVSTICRQWTNFVPCYLPIIKNIVTYNRTSGVFFDNQLVSLTVESEHGGLGMGLTESSFRGRGLMGLAAVDVARHMGQQGFDIHYWVNKKNVSSLRALNKINLGKPVADMCHFRLV